MKDIKNYTKMILLITACLLVSCVSSTGKKKRLKGKGDEALDKGFKISKIFESNIPEGAVDSGFAIKTFNQYNATLSKITGIDSGTSVISNEYISIRNSLPANHKSAKYTAFHQVSVTRLAFAYSNEFIESNTEFKNLDYVAISNNEIISKILKKFLGANLKDNISESKKLYIGNIKQVLTKIMNNDAGLNEEGVQIGQLITMGNPATRKKNLTKMACAALLASSEFSVL